jgi:hypothetical protein
LEIIRPFPSPLRVMVLLALGVKATGLLVKLPSRITV